MAWIPVFFAATVVAFWRVRPLAGALLPPYLGWRLSATSLDAGLPLGRVTVDHVAVGGV